VSTTQDVKARIGSVKNIQKITRAMEMVAAARLRRAEQRIAALRPYAGRNAAIGEQGLTNGPVTLYLGALEVTLGRLDEAGRHLAEASRSARSWGDPSSGAVVAVHRGRLLALQGRHEEGMARARAAVAKARRSGSERIAVVAAGLETWWPTPDPRPPGADGGPRQRSDNDARQHCRPRCPADSRPHRRGNHVQRARDRDPVPGRP